MCPRCSYGSLFAKLWRVKKIFLNPRIGQGPVRVSTMALYVLLLIVIDVGILAGLTVRRAHTHTPNSAEACHSSPWHGPSMCLGP